MTRKPEAGALASGVSGSSAVANGEQVRASVAVRVRGRELLG